MHEHKHTSLDTTHIRRENVCSTASKPGGKCCVEHSVPVQRRQRIMVVQAGPIQAQVAWCEVCMRVCECLFWEGGMVVATAPIYRCWQASARQPAMCDLTAAHRQAHCLSLHTPHTAHTTALKSRLHQHQCRHCCHRRLCTCRGCACRQLAR
jgi:hypothetical protein